MGALHIVQGDAKGDKAELEARARDRHDTISWIVPKSAAVGDDVVIYIVGQGFFATARVNARPSKRHDWKNRYGASIAGVRLIDPAISLATIRRQLPGFAWAVYPRHITTPSVRQAEQLRRLVAHRRRTRLPSLDSASLRAAGLAELRAAAVLRSRSHLPELKRSTIIRIRSEAIRLYVLRRASGRCEACDDPGPFRTPDGSLYLEPHHTRRVADGGPDHPSNVIAVCPNCHCRAHHGEDAKRFNRSLIKKARHLARSGAA
jgi:hypothetical protein